MLAEAPPGWRVLHLAAVASTNDEARTLAQEGHPGRIAVVARTQTAGRGRRGRVWRSGLGGLFLSAVLRPDIEARLAGALPLAAGLAVADVVARFGLAPTLRWPNDVLVGERKVAGVLCESRVEASPPRIAWVVVGIGLNVAQPPDALGAVGGASLQELGAPVFDPDHLVHPLLAALEARVALAGADPEGLAAAWAARAPWLGGPVKFETEAGLEAAVAEGVAADGALVLRLPGGERRHLTDPELVRLHP